MANVPPPPITRRSPLWGLSFKVESIAIKFTNLSSDIHDVWLIGQWLYLPFYWIAYYLTQAVYVVREADSWVAEHRSWLERLYDGSMFSAILNQVSSTLAWIRSDPLGWLRYQLSLISNELMDIITNSRYWFRSKLQQIFPQLFDLDNNPYSWIRNLMLNAFGIGGRFIIDPFGTLRTIITNVSPFLGGLVGSGLEYIINEINNRTGWFRQFINNPSQVIRQFLVQSSNEINDLLNSPILWFKQKLASILGISLTDTDMLSTNLGIIVLEKIRNNVSQYRQRIQTIVCDIIMMFI